MSRPPDPAMTPRRMHDVLRASAQVAVEEAPPLVARTPAVKFDGTINLGHILTGLTMLAAGAGAYFNLDKRVEIQAREIAVLDRQAQEHGKRVLDALEDLREQQKETTRTLNSIQNDVMLLRGRAAAEVSGGKR